MEERIGSLVSIHTGDTEELSKQARVSARLELDGFVGDRHRGFERIAASYDRDPTGTVRRNERQWSGVSIEELAMIRERLDLAQRLDPGTLGANICVEGIPAFSRLPKGSRLVFPSGAVLLVEEGNPPCIDIGALIASTHTTRSGGPVDGRKFPRYAMGLRGVVGVVDVPGSIQVGDRVIVEVYDPPSRQETGAG
jgi:MOSC domain-containing protein YiiM